MHPLPHNNKWRKPPEPDASPGYTFHMDLSTAYNLMRHPSRHNQTAARIVCQMTQRWKRNFPCYRINRCAAVEESASPARTHSPASRREGFDCTLVKINVTRQSAPSRRSRRSCRTPPRDRTDIAKKVYTNFHKDFPFNPSIVETKPSGWSPSGLEWPRLEPEFGALQNGFVSTRGGTWSANLIFRVLCSVWVTGYSDWFFS